MRSARQFVADRASPYLARARVGDRTELFTRAAGPPPPVYGERWVSRDDVEYRSFEPGRSKLSAAVVHGWTGPLPAPGERWLYLGAATGTTASHVGDLVGSEGRVYAIERSPRPFSRLLGLAGRWTPIRPILGDARSPRDYGAVVPTVDGLYADIAQPDQVEIVRQNAELFLAGPGAAVVFALKTASLGRDRTPADHLAIAERSVGADVELVPSVRLDPFHRGHFLVGGRARPSLFGQVAPRPVRWTPGRPRGPRRR